MRIAATFTLGLMFLAGCHSARRAAGEAEEQYTIVVTNGGSADERCAAARKVADAWLAARDNDKWKMADLRADLDCNAAEQDRLGI